MPIPPGFTVSGTPDTSSLGTGAIVGNALTISGITFQPSGPGWTLRSANYGPGLAEGTWQSAPYASVAQRSGQGQPAGLNWSGGETGNVNQSGGGGGALTYDERSGEFVPQPQGRITPAGWAVLLLLAVAIFKGGK